MLDQMVRDYTGSISEAEEAVAQSIGNLRMMEADQKEAEEAAGDWGNKAAAAAAKADQLRAAGSTAEADTLRQPGPRRAQAADRLRGPGQGPQRVDRAAGGRGREAEDGPQLDGAGSSRS